MPVEQPYLSLSPGTTLNAGRRPVRTQAAVCVPISNLWYRWEVGGPVRIVAH